MKSFSTVLLNGAVVFGLIVCCSALAFLPLELPTGTSPAARRFAFFLTGNHSSDFLKTADWIGPRRANRLSFGQVLRLITVSAAKHNVPAPFVRSIVAAESGFNSEAISPRGAIGLMQLMPETAKEYGADASQPDQNVDAGTHYLRFLMDRYHSGRNPLQRVIAAYNAGPGMVDKYRGIPPFRETRGYVTRVLGFLRQFSR